MIRKSPPPDSSMISATKNSNNRSVITAAAATAHVIMYHLQIVNVEEDFLLAAFGNEYLQYKKKVCR
mgnify:CR=1 FL=1